MPHNVAVRTYRRHREFYQGISDALPATPTPIQAAILLISGCQDVEFSMDGDENGLFTGTLMDVGNRGVFQGNYADFHQAILNAIPAYYNQHPNYFTVGVSDPVFEGQEPFKI